MSLSPLTITEIPVIELTPFHKNPRKGNVSAIAESLAATGQYKPIVVNAGTHTGRPMEILAGNHTFLAARSLGWDSVQAVTVDVPDEVASKIVLADNRLADIGGYDNDVLAELLQGLDGDLEATGYNDADLVNLLTDPNSLSTLTLTDRFGAPPVTVLSARDGAWQERKKTWKSMGLVSELGRGEALVYNSVQTRYKNWFRAKNEAEAEAGRQLSEEEVIRAKGHLLDAVAEGTSVFDPALSELVLSWFSAPGARVIDPWAGGSVRGIVAGALGREYVGIELRPEQVEANRLQLPVIRAAIDAGIGRGGTDPEWVVGATVEALGGMPSESFDLAFSAPPRYDMATRVDGSTPIEPHGGFMVKRDDLFEVAGSRGGKARSCWALARRLVAEGAEGLVTAGARQSPQVEIVSLIAKKLGVKCAVVVPAGEDTSTTESALAAGAEVVRVKAGRNTVIKARARELAAERAWGEIPFGMECSDAVEQTSSEVRSLLELPVLPVRIVVPVGSGMSAAGILRGLEELGLDIPVVGVRVGADPTKRLDEYAPGWRDRMDLVKSPLPYEEHADETMLGDLRLDPVYEAKCLPFLKRGDLLWAVGCRVMYEFPPFVDPTWIEGESVEELRDMDAASFDVAFGCPPYYNLEVYSDDPRDLSNLTVAGFDEAMAANIAEVARVLRDDSFAVFVVGSVRDKKGRILDMRRCMSQAAEAAGMYLVNDAVLLTPIGNAAPRAARGFTGTRVLTRVHQEVLVYCKGDRKRAAARCGSVEDGAIVKVKADDDWTD